MPLKPREQYRTKNNAMCVRWSAKHAHVVMVYDMNPDKIEEAEVLVELDARMIDCLVEALATAKRQWEMPTISRLVTDKRGR